MGDNNRDGLNWKDFMGEDRLHPNDRGHQLLADLVIYLIQQTAVDLMTHPLTPTEVALANSELPPPMFDGAAPGGGIGHGGQKQSSRARTPPPRQHTQPLTHPRPPPPTQTPQATRPAWSRSARRART
jgi:hypothetical protein